MKLVADRAGRADRFLAEQFPGRGRRLLARLFDEGGVRVNGRRARKGDPIAPGDVVELAEEPPDAAALRPLAQPELPLDILLVDEHLLALAKPPGMPTCPLRAGERGTLASALVARFPECATVGDDPREAGLAHRLDAGTSGALLAARDEVTWRALRQAFHEGRVDKEYLALVVGEVSRAGVVDAPIAHERGGGVRVCADAEEGSRPAVTRYEPLRRFRAFTLLRCVARTGRMHQVRAHLAYAGIPIVGDERYGIRVTGEPTLTGHFLHASRLELVHPAHGTPVVVEAPLPADRQAALQALEPL